MAGPGGAEAFRAVRRTAGARRALVLLLGLDAALAWIVVLGIHTFVQRAWWGLAGQGLEPGALERHWAQVETARLAHGLVWLGVAVAFLLWVHGAWRLLELAGVPGRRFSPRAAVAGFLMPVLNVAGGYLVVRELARACAGGGRPAGPLVGWWWALFLVASVLDPAVLRLAGGAEYRLALGRPTVVLVAGLLAEIAAAVLAIAIVRRTASGLADLVARHGLA
jgi:hypothetical protein